jgi:diadenosine tetraphosphatase ApaH/serine/threonine PP2A family protein phosphatase
MRKSWRGAATHAWGTCSRWLDIRQAAAPARQPAIGRMRDDGQADRRPPVKLALLSDLHANRQALQACLADARARGASQYAFLGDLVGYGGEPGAVLDTVMEMAAQGAWVVRGNHDDAALAPLAGSARADHAGAAWTATQLTAAHRQFLDALPLTLRHGSILLVHASAHDPDGWTYVVDAPRAADSLDHADDATHVFGGHVHQQRLFFRGASGKVMAFEPTAGVAVPVPRHRRWLATVGSTGQPRDGRSDAMYALFDSDAFTLTFMRVPYDHAAAARAIRAAGLPEADAARLAEGR